MDDQLKRENRGQTPVSLFYHSTNASLTTIPIFCHCVACLAEHALSWRDVHTISRNADWRTDWPGRPGQTT